MAKKPRLYQDVYNLMLQNPHITPAEAGRQLGYKQELHWKSKTEFRVCPKHRHSDGARTAAEHLQRIGPKNIPKSIPGFDRHHKRMIMLYRPLYKGLNEADSYKLSLHAVKQGMPLGDVDQNYELLRKSDHNELHRYMEKQGMRPSDMPDFSKASLENRIKAFDVLYRDFLQPDIDKKTESLKAESPEHYTANFKDWVDYTNTRVDMSTNGQSPVRNNAFTTAITNVGKRALTRSVPGVGTALSANNTKNRFNEFKEAPNIQNGVQLAASAVETGFNGFSDFAAATGVGLPFAAGAEAIANGAGAIDEGIDVFEQLQSP